MVRWLGVVVLAGLVGCSGDGEGSDGFPDRDNPSAPDIPPALDVVDSWEGDLSEGSVPDDLQFLVSAQCVPGTELVNFDGAHVYYTYEQDPGVQVYVRVQPERGVDVSLYVSQLPDGNTGTGQEAIAIPCEESLDYANDNNPGTAETVKLTSIDKGYHLVIGVAGANGTTEGAFQVEIYEEE